MLDPLVPQVFDKGLSPATKTVYQSVLCQYQWFCLQFDITPLPLTEHSQTAFAVYLSLSVSAGTMQSYLCAITLYQIRAGVPDPTLPYPPLLSFPVLKGNHPAIHANSASPLLPYCWLKQPLSYDKLMQAFCLGFRGFMCSGEFISPLPQDPDTCMLSMADVAIDFRQNLLISTVLICQIQN